MKKLESEMFKLPMMQAQYTEQTFLMLGKALFISQNGLIITDPNQPDNPIIYVNPSFVRITGYTPEDCLGQNCRILKHDDSDNPVRAQMRDAIARGEEFKGVLKNRRKDGTSYWNELIISPVYDPCGKLIYFVGVQQDISENIRLEEELQEKNRLLSSILENLPSMIFLKDAGQLRFQYLNKAGEQLLGYPRHDLINKSDFDVFPEAQARFFAEKDREVLSRKTLQDIPQEEIQTGEKGKRILHTQKVPLLDEKGEATYLLGISEDITERVALEEERKSLVKKLQESAELRRNFVSTLTHDLRTPLIAQQRVLIVMNEDPTVLKDPHLSSLVDGFRQNNKHLLDMVNKLLDVYQLEEGVIKPLLEPIALRPFVNESFQEIRELAQAKGIHLENRITEDLPPIRADYQMLKRVFGNLVGNALENCPAESIITLSAEETATAIQVSVQDNGPGINPEMLPYLFDRYAKGYLTRRKIGSGLGLYICKMIIELHGGTIQVHSTLGQGSTFTFYLPKMSVDEK